MLHSPHPDRSSCTRRRLWPFIGLTLLLLSIVLAQTFKQPLLVLISGQTETTRITPPPCDLNRQDCLLPLITPVASEAPWFFSISPQPIPVSAPLTLTLTPPARVLQGNHPDNVWVDLTGENMDMGLIRIPLTHNANGRWEGTGSIPICVTGQMRWRARLYLQLEQTVVEADWVFTAPLAAAPHTVN